MNKIRNFIKAAFSRISVWLKTWFNTTNRKKYLIGGFIVGLLACAPWAAIYAAAVAGSCLKLKDHLYGNKWDWTDWALTVIGGSIAALIHFVL